MADSYKPNKEMQQAAARGLELRKQYGRGGTAVGVARARDISNGKNLPLETVKRMRSFFARHASNKKAEGFEKGEKGYPSAGYIAFLLWGGAAGEEWARGITEREKKKDSKLSEREDLISELA